MIYKLSGTVDGRTDSAVIVDAGGVGYGVVVPARILGDARDGERISLFIETAVREDSITLYGFASAADKDLFNMLTSVQSIGPKAGMSIMSALTSGEAAAAIASGNAKAFTAAGGIGAKTAARIVSELKDKIGRLGIAAASLQAKQEAGGVGPDAVSALVNMGYSRVQAANAVYAAMAESKDAGIGEVIRRALLKA
ncbi:MAG: Holliday junction branch migration protein RuvA [Rickettsiales bacterium]|jgi:Holliday junction DNA helicase RuvA|nr:Holliday junction branch migration protein RuvA [Rickettsiales bacterium]